MNQCPISPRSPFEGRSPNPFATRYTRPGAIPPLDRDGEPLDLTALGGRLFELGAAAVEGPHGHGKSTLLHALADVLRAAGSVVNVVRIRRLADACTAGLAIVAAPRGAVVFVDGWERLGLLAGPLRLATRVLHRTLLVTSHRPSGLPVLWECETTPALLTAIVARLPDHGGLVAEDDIAAAFHRHRGNLRESLYELYDRVEERGGVAVAAPRR